MFTKNTFYRIIGFGSALVLLATCNSRKLSNEVEILQFSPTKLTAKYTEDSILIDGKLTEESWNEAEWTPYFIDIEGESKPDPRYDTRAKITWDEDAIYFAAELEEPHLWATFTERESIIFHENNFEVFIDPDGDTHDYFEYEINALGTEWDLKMNKPYIFGGRADSDWDVEGIQAAVVLKGTLNDPSDFDKGWVVEIAMPWESLLTEGVNKPKDGDVWRINFSRVEWQIEDQNGVYTKIIGDDGDPLPENNWVWSSTGKVNMHMPEHWGYVKFSTSESTNFELESIEELKWLMRIVFNEQNKYYEENGSYAQELSSLGFSEELPIEIHLIEETFELVSQQEGNKTLVLRKDSKIYIE